MKIETNYPQILDELKLVVKLFFVDEDMESLNIFHTYEIKNSFLINTIIVKDKKEFKHTKVTLLTKEEREEQAKYINRYVKIALYEVLSKATRKKLPWGALTGIRPTKLYYEFLEKNNYYVSKTKKEFKKIFHLSKKRLDILQEIIEQQQFIRECKNADNVVDLYINIPFCTTKCYYCSFVSLTLNKSKDIIQPYIDTLVYEIKNTLQIIKENKYKINSIYVGGGTPTAITDNQLESILKTLPKIKGEFTVEGGRPDSITLSKLKLLKKYKVTRISINPQTFNDETLKEIGRNHTTEEVLKVYEMTKPFGFNINMDLIAGLSKESFVHFKKSLQKTIELQPDNITIHTLSIKKSSHLKMVGGEVSEVKETEKMINYSIKKLRKNSYFPYYLYRQKNMLGNLENIGYTKDKKVCVFNVNSMEEICSVVACGANGISKRYFSKTNRIERCANVKNIADYLKRVEEMLDRKRELFKK